MLLLELVEILSSLITCFILVARVESIRMLIKFHDCREIVDGTDKNFLSVHCMLGCLSTA